SVPPFYQGYVKQVMHLPLAEALSDSHHQLRNLLEGRSENIASYRYATNKWSVAELLCHMLDAERIFCYRALRFARNDATELSSFDENKYAPEANAENRTLQGLLQEAWHLRQTTLDLFNSFAPQMLQRIGKVNGNPMSVLTLGYCIAGHETHHRKILEERYLINA
ncbi:MAG: DinB family protein, partial [Cyclobacteriaceae bacterium]|nr:DinB family protein [Cyclobacteriaceae bacterium]